MNSASAPAPERLGDVGHRAGGVAYLTAQQESRTLRPAQSPRTPSRPTHVLSAIPCTSSNCSIRLLRLLVADY